MRERAMKITIKAIMAKVHTHTHTNIPIIKLLFKNNNFKSGVIHNSFATPVHIFIEYCYYSMYSFPL
jgi:hypothetical protein